MDKKERTRLRVQRYRERGKSTDNVTHDVTQDITVDTTGAAKLLMVCNALDRQMGGLTGNESLLDLVRYGVYGPTMREVKARLS